MNSIQIRDASDITKFKKMRAIQQNYTQLQAKNQLPIGGIPQTDLMAVGRYYATYIVNASRIATVTVQTDCPECSETVEYTQGQIVANGCAPCLGSSYQPSAFTQLFRS